MTSTFLICPHRGVDPEKYLPHVQLLEAEGYAVYWPTRDTEQEDSSGFWVCKDNLDAMFNADFVHVIWDGVSQGCLFDLGMAFALAKKIKVVMLPDATEEKSFQNMIEQWAEEFS